MATRSRIKKIAPAPYVDPRTPSQKAIDLIGQTLEGAVDTYGRYNEKVTMIEFLDRVEKNGLVSAMEWVGADLVEQPIKAQAARGSVYLFARMIMRGESVIAAARRVRDAAFEDLVGAARDGTSTSAGHNFVREIKSKALAEVASSYGGNSMFRLYDSLVDCLNSALPGTDITLRPEEIEKLKINELVTRRPMDAEELERAKRYAGEEGVTDPFVNEYGPAFAAAEAAGIERIQKHLTEKKKR